YVGALDSKDTRRLFDADTRAEFVPPDYLVFLRQDALLAQRLNLETLETIGEPIAVGEGAATEPNLVASLAVSASSVGSLVYLPCVAPLRKLIWLDRSGKQIGSIGEPDTMLAVGGLSASSMSPDGSTVALERSVNGNVDIWLMETARGLLRRLTSDPGIDRN